MVQNLAALVAEFQGEALVRIPGLDYALLNQAGRTIVRLLETLFDGLDDSRVPRNQMLRPAVTKGEIIESIV